MGYEDLIKKLVKEKIKFVIVGGIAVNLLGALRSTADLDILPELSFANLTRLIKLLGSLGFKTRTPIPIDILSCPSARRRLLREKNLIALNYSKLDEIKEIDIIINSTISFKNAWAHRTMISLGSFKAPVISINDLIKMKSVTDRAVDKLDSLHLKTLRRSPNAPHSSRDKKSKTTR
jgi:hypothetical protein